MASTEHWHLDVMYLEADKAGADLCLLLNEWSFDKDQRMLSWRTKDGAATWYVDSTILAGWKVYAAPEWCKQVPPPKPEDAFVRMHRLNVVFRIEGMPPDATPHPDGWPGRGEALRTGERLSFVVPKDTPSDVLQQLHLAATSTGVLADSFLMPKAWLRPGMEENPLRRCDACPHPAHLGACLGLAEGVGDFACKCSRRTIATT